MKGNKGDTGSFIKPISHGKPA